jgi:hypothetical protein
MVRSARWAEESFDRRPCRTVGQRLKPQRPTVAQLLTNRSREVRGLQALSLGLGSLEARGTLVGPIDAIAAALYRPNRHPIGREERSSCFRGKAHGILIGCGYLAVEPGWRSLRSRRRPRELVDRALALAASEAPELANSSPGLV